MKNQVKAVSLILALVLLLSLLPIGALAATHTHSYKQTIFSEGYEYFNSQYHGLVVTYKYSCSCGDTYYEPHLQYTLPHSPVGSGQYVGNCLGSSGETLWMYQYHCRVCAHNYIIYSPTQL